MRDSGNYMCQPVEFEAVFINFYCLFTCSRLEFIRPNLLALYRTACLHRDDMSQVRTAMPLYCCGQCHFIVVITFLYYCNNTNNVYAIYLRVGCSPQSAVEKLLALQPRGTGPGSIL